MAQNVVERHIQPIWYFISFMFSLNRIPTCDILELGEKEFRKYSQGHKTALTNFQHSKSSCHDIQP